MHGMCCRQTPTSATQNHWVQSSVLKVLLRTSQRPYRSSYSRQLQLLPALLSIVSFLSNQLSRWKELLTTPRRRSPWQRWSCRPRLANRYLPQPGPATQHPCSDHRLSRLRTFHRLSHRSRSDCGRHLSRQLGSKNSQNPTGEHCHPRPKSRNSSLKRRCAKLHRPIKQSDPR